MSVTIIAAFTTLILNVLAVSLLSNPLAETSLCEPLWCFLWITYFVLILQLAFSQYQENASVPNSVGFYLLTDGKPDTSMSLVMNEVAEMNVGRNIVINTISFNCPDR